jgi:hypothetical protein
MRQKVIETEIGRPTEKQNNRYGKIETEKQKEKHIQRHRNRDTETETQIDGRTST